MTDEDYQAALVRIDVLMDAAPGSAEGNELDALTTLIEQYEDEYFPIDRPTPAMVVRFRMEQQGVGSDQEVTGPARKVQEQEQARK